MGQPLTLDEVEVTPESAAQVIYDLRREVRTLRDLAARDQRDVGNARTLIAQGKSDEAFDLLRRPARHGAFMTDRAYLR